MSLASDESQHKRKNSDGRLTAPDLLSLGRFPEHLFCPRNRVLTVGVFHLLALCHLTYMSFLFSHQVFLGVQETWDSALLRLAATVVASAGSPLGCIFPSSKAQWGSLAEGGKPKPRFDIPGQRPCEHDEVAAVADA